MAAIVLAVVAFLAVLAGVTAVIVLARRQASLDTPPASQPTDFVAKVGSGGYRFRETDESPEAFQERVAKERRAPSAPPPKPGP